MSVPRRGFLAIASATLGMAAEPLGRRPRGVAPSEGSPEFPVGRYGACGDGVTDDTDAIQKAIDDAIAAGGGIVSLPRGVFKCDALTVAHNITIRGAGREVTSLRALTRSATTFLSNRDLTVPGRNIGLEEIEVLLPALGTAAHTLLGLRNASYGRIHRCRFIGSGVDSSIGVDIDSAAPAQSYYNVIADNQFLNCGIGLRIRNQANCNSVEARNVFEGCVAPLLIDGSCNTIVNGNAFQDNVGAVCVHLTGGTQCQFNAITFNFFERQSVGVLFEPDVEYNALIGNQYSVSPRRYVDNSGKDQLILETCAGSFVDTGQVPQLMRVFSRAAGLLQASDGYDRTVMHVPGTVGKNPGQVFVQLKDADGANRWVVIARGALATLDVFPDGAEAPSVDPKAGPVFRCGKSSPTVITGLRDGVPGQVIWIVMDERTTLSHGPSLQLQGKLDVIGTQRPIVNLVNVGGGRWVDVLRS